MEAIYALKGRGVYTVNALKFEKGVGCTTPPPSSYGGTAPVYNNH